MALLSYPFSSLPELYSNTTLITKTMDIDRFYRKLQKEGGIIQVYEDGLTFVSVVLNISLEGSIKVLGTFEKISSGFVNIAYTFPQKKIDNKVLSEASLRVGE